MTTVAFRSIALMSAGAFLLAGCGAGVASTDDPGTSASGSSSSSASKQVDVASFGTDLRAEPPGQVNPPGNRVGCRRSFARFKPTTKSCSSRSTTVRAPIRRSWTSFVRQGIPVTPFLTKSEIASSKDYYKKISEMTGQKVQDHTITHPQMPGLSADGQKQICEPASSYTEWFGTKPWMFRPPYGEFNATTQQAAKACGMDYIVLWNASLPKAHIRYAQGDKLKPGDIILTHWRPDLYKHLPRALATFSSRVSRSRPCRITCRSAANRRLGRSFGTRPRHLARRSGLSGEISPI